MYDIESLYGLIRTSPEAGTIPLEAALSLPLPVPGRDGLLFRCLAYRKKRDRETGHVQVYRPFAAITVDPAAKVVAEVRTLPGAPEPIGTLAAPQGAPGQEQDLYRTLGEVSQWVGRGASPGQTARPLSEPERAKARHLGDLLDGFLLPALRPFLAQACPDFFALLEEAGRP